MPLEKNFDYSKSVDYTWNNIGISFELHDKLLKIHRFRKPLLKNHGFHGTHGTYANAVNEYELAYHVSTYLWTEFWEKLDFGFDPLKISIQ